LQNTVRQVCAGQGPQLTVCPQVLTTRPHLPWQVVSRDSGVQQAFWKQTWPGAQQAPLQRTTSHVQAEPSPLQVVWGGHAPQPPPQPSGPQTLPAQVRAQQAPWARLQTQLRISGQSLSLLQLPVQATATHWPFVQAVLAAQQAPSQHCVAQLVPGCPFG
jgi:hypothetical protein